VQKEIKLSFLFEAVASLLEGSYNCVINGF